MISKIRFVKQNKADLEKLRGLKHKPDWVSVSPLNEDISYRKKAKKYRKISELKREMQKTIEKNVLQSMQELMENNIEQRWKD